MITEFTWWKRAEKLPEYAVLVSVLSEQSRGKGHDRRLERARKALDVAMAKLGMPRVQP